MPKDLPSIEDLNKMLRYDANTGRFFWRERPIEFFPDARAWKIWNTRYAGKETATRIDSHGYRIVNIHAHPYQAHRVAWALHYKKWPTYDIDHKNGDGGDNRIENLRDVPKLINHRNKRRHLNNTSGHNGVSWHKPTSKWKAHITIAGKNTHLGRYERIEDAIEARRRAEEGLGFTKRHGSAAP